MRVKKILSRLYFHFKRTLHILLLQSGFLNYLGFIALGERNRYGFSPIYRTLDFAEADINVNLAKATSLPFQTSSIKRIYSSHMLEHLPELQVKRLIRECFRCLQLGGELLIDLPDAELIYNAYLQGKFDDDQVHNNEFSYTLYRDKKTLEVISQTYGPEASLTAQRGYVAFYTSFACDMKRTEENDLIELPLIIEKSEIDENIKKRSMDDFFSYLVSKLGPDRMENGGHVSSWYPKKMGDLLKGFGFTVQTRRCGEKFGRLNFLQKLLGHSVPDRGHRSFVSFRLSAIK